MTIDFEPDVETPPKIDFEPEEGPTSSAVAIDFQPEGAPDSTPVEDPNEWSPARIAAHNLQAERLRGLPPGSLEDTNEGVMSVVDNIRRRFSVSSMAAENAYAPMGYSEIEPEKSLLTLAKEGIVEKPIIGGLPRPTGDSVAAGVVRGVEALAEGLTTPMNVGLLATISGAPAVIQKIASGGFAAHMATTLPEQIIQAAEAETPGAKAEAWTGAIGTALMTVAAGAHAAGRPGVGGLRKGETVETADRIGSRDVEAPASVERINKTVDAELEKITTQDPVQTAAETIIPPEPGKTTAEVAEPAPPETKPAVAEPPPPVPPKEAPPAAPVADSAEPSPTGIRNSIVDKERVERGLPERMEPLRRTFGTIWEEAMAKADADPQAGSKLVKEVEANPRPLEDVESALLAHEQVTRQNVFDKAVEEVNNATTEQARTEASAKLASARDSVQEVYDAGQKAGTKSGQSLAARKLLVNEDFSLAKMEATTRAIVNEGKPLSAQQAAEIKALHEKISSTEKKLAEFENLEQSRQASTAFENLLKEQKKEAAATAKTGAKITDFLDEQAAKARERIIARRGRLNVTVDPLNVAGLVDEAIIGASYIAKGVTKVADWSTQMVKDFGERIKPYLNDLFERSKQFHDANAQMFKPGGKAKASPLEKAKAGKALDPQVVFDLAREKVNEGVTDLDAVIKAVHKDLEPLQPGLTEREVRDAFTGYGKTKFPSKEADLTKLRELRRVGQLVSAIEDAMAKEAPKKTGSQRDKPTQVIRDKMKDLQKAMREMGIETTTPETQLATANQARATQLRNQIEDLDRQLKTGQKPPKGQPAPTTPEVEKLRAERDSMKAQLKEIEDAGKTTRTPDEISLAASKKAIAKRTEELNRRIAAGDYAKPAKKEPLMDKEKADLLFENAKAKEQYARGLFEAQLAKRSLAGKILGGAQEILNLSRAIMTGGEFSASLRQGGFIVFSTLSHPRFVLTTLAKQFKAFRSERNQHRIMSEIRESKFMKNGMIAQSKLFLHDERTMDLTKMEEKFQSRLAEKVPFIAGSARAYTTFLNALRVGKFEIMAKSFGRGGDITLEQGKLIANYINAATGRGKLGVEIGGVRIGLKEQAADGLNSVLFAPRFVASRFQMLAMEPIWNPKYKVSARDRALIASEYGKFLIGVGAVYGLASLAFEEGDGVEMDPRSSDFGKIRFGKTRIDPLSGLQQVTVLLSRLKTGETKRLNGDIVPIRGEGARQGATVKVGTNFLRSKLAPLPGFVWDATSQEDFRGRPVKLLPSEFGFPPDSSLGNLLVPMTYGDIVQAMQNQGLPKATAISLAAMFGAGVKTYVDDD